MQTLYPALTGSLQNGNDHSFAQQKPQLAIFIHNLPYFLHVEQSWRPQAARIEMPQIKKPPKASGVSELRFKRLLMLRLVTAVGFRGAVLAGAG